ncbi:MAG: hypothetical protein FJW80_07565 [Actinobacteria bacterium]|nr:hypothetical protein [Actinomycetota bacterium]
MSLTLLSRSPRPESTTPASPPAARTGRAWWRDGRIVGGILIIIVSVVLGARLMASDDDTVAVWQVNRDVAAGTVLSAADVTAVDVPTSTAAAYALASGLPVDRLSRDIRAGELVPVVEDSSAPDVRWVTVPVEPLHAPTDLLPGERVDVWATRSDDLAAATPPRLVLPAALVSSVATDSVGFGGEYGVVLEVTPEAAGDVLEALRSGAIDLVRVPAVTP